MLFYPAIDIIKGNCVRLAQGSLSHKKIYDVDPCEQAMIYQSDGAQWIHVVDLDGAFSGDQRNQKKIIEMSKSTKCHIQVGGGIRNLHTIETLISNGVDRVVLGTVAVKNPVFVKEACKNFPKKIVLGVDSRNDKVSIEGWTKSGEIEDTQLIKKFEDVGVTHIIFTDISRDGRMIGPNIKKLELILNSTNIDVISSGGVSSLSDLKDIADLKKSNLEGIICGKALYEKEFTVFDALNVLGKNQDA